MVSRASLGCPCALLAADQLGVSFNQRRAFRGVVRQSYGQRDPWKPIRARHPPAAVPGGRSIKIVFPEIRGVDVRRRCAIDECARPGNRIPGRSDRHSTRGLVFLGTICGAAHAGVHARRLAHVPAGAVAKDSAKAGGVVLQDLALGVLAHVAVLCAGGVVGIVARLSGTAASER